MLNGKPTAETESYSTASRTPRSLATITKPLVWVWSQMPSSSNCLRTWAVSAIAGMALGDTKLPMSNVSNPTRNKLRK